MLCLSGFELYSRWVPLFSALIIKSMFPYGVHKEYETVSKYVLRTIKYRIQVFMVKLL